MELVADDVVFRRTALFITYLRRFLNHLDQDSASSALVEDYEVRILHLAYFVTVYATAFFKEETLLARRFHAEACHAAAEFDRITLAVITKSPLSLGDLHGLFAALKSNHAAYSDWLTEANSEKLATDTQRILGAFIQVIESLPHDEIIEGSLRVSSTCTKISFIVNGVYDSTLTPSMCRLMTFIADTREKFPSKSFPPMGYTKSSFAIDAIIDRATPPIEDGVFHIDLEGDHAMDSVKCLKLVEIQGSLIFCYAITVTRGAPDSLAIMMLNHTSRELRKHPSLVQWARDFYEQIQNEHFEEIRQDRANDEHMKHNSIIGADIAPPCSTPRSLSA